MRVAASQIKYNLNLYDAYRQPIYEGETARQQYDCLYYDVIDHLLLTNKNHTFVNQLMTYCFQLDNKNSTFTYDNTTLSTVAYKNYTFAQLKEQSISSSQLLDWFASIDLTESYQVYLDGEIQTSSAHFRTMLTEQYIFYNCTSPWFGPRCQYYFSFPPIPFQEYVKKIHFSQFSLFPPRHTCYVHITCIRESVELCLDWREICNGEEDCLNGEDENECWKLEANECDEDEYRCHNGQCIPLDFYHDDISNPDCLDRSDEPMSLTLNHRCPIDLKFRCEEAACYPQILGSMPFSCGDGQCVFPGLRCHSNRHIHNKQLSEFDSFPSDLTSRCWVAMLCITRYPYNPQSCGHALGTSNYALSVRFYCPPNDFYFPSTSVLLGHVYYVYNRIKIDHENDLMAPMYVCFDRTYCTMKNISLHHILNRTCIDYESKFGVLFSAYPGWAEMNKVIEASLSMTCLSTKTDCPHPSLYPCDHSTKCISTVRLRDGIKNCPFGDDEGVVGTCSLNRTNTYQLKCFGEDYCVSSTAISNGEPDCPFKDDEIDPIQRYLQSNIMFKFICDSIQDLLPILIHGENTTDESDCDQWPCNNSYTRCNSVWNCPKGEDELGCDNVAMACPPLQHPCISPETMKLFCLPIENVGNDAPDCIGGSDERQFCRSIAPWQHKSRYHCWEKNYCEFIESIETCETKIDRKFYYTSFSNYNCDEQNSTSIDKHLCSLEDNQDYRTLEFPISKVSENKLERNQNIDEHPISIREHVKYDTDSCFRGLPIHVRTQNGILSRCMCPPSTYGDHCEYQNQRISLTVQAQSASDWRSVFTFVFILLTDQNEVESHDHRYYSPSTDCAIKWNIYLLYRSRPNNPTKNYSVRVDVYKRETSMVEYRASWYYPVDFSFLPVYRLSIQINIPSYATIIDETVCTLDCHGHGACTVANPSTKKKRTICRCHPGWFGDQCQYDEMPAVPCSCAPNSLCISSYPTSTCVCPLGRGGPRCYIKLELCQNSRECLNGGQCIPDDERRPISFVQKCLCHGDFWGDQCQFLRNKLIVTFHPKISIPSLILLHIIQDKHLIRHQRITTFQKIHPYENSAVIRTTVNQFDLVFTEFDNSYYLISFERNNNTEINMIVSSENYCPSVNELFNSTIAKFDLLRRIKYYQVPCKQHLNLSCFYDEVHMCICDPNRFAVCILFEHNETHICQGDFGNCENDGGCFQDDAKCPTISACLCQDCFYGSRCQFSTKGFSLSLDSILGYQIRPETSFSRQIFVIKFSLILISIMFIIGIINGLVCALVFIRTEAQKVGCGLYLFATSLISVLIVIMLVLKFTFLLLTQMTYITNLTFLHIQCVCIDFIIRVCLNFSDWLHACVSIERTSAVVQGASFDKIKSKQIAKRLISILSIIIAISNLHDPIYRRLIIDDVEQRTWCIVRHTSSIQIYNSVTQIFHFLLPFLCNIISALIIIYSIAHRRFFIQNKQSFKKYIHKQLSQHKHLIISPVILIILATPRLNISILSGCMKSSRDPWLFLTGYFTSFAPSLLIFAIFILPSKTYKTECKNLF